MAGKEVFHHCYNDGNVYTPLKFNSSPLKNDGWKMSLHLGFPIFRGYVKFPGCTSNHFMVLRFLASLLMIDLLD